MADTPFTELGAYNQYPDNINILKDNKFKFVIRKTPHVNFFCTAVTIPEVKLPAIRQNTPFQKLPLPGTGMDFDPLEIEFLVDEQLRNYYEINNWVRGLGFVKDFDQYASLKQERTDLNQKYGGIWADVFLHVLTNEGNPSVNIVFRDAFPIWLSKLRFDSKKPTPEPQIATAQFVYAYYEFEYPEV